MLRSLSLLFALVLLTTGAQAQENWFKRGHGRAPSLSKAFICHGYTCRLVTPVYFTADEFSRIGRQLAAGTRDAAEERAAISRAVQAFETFVGARIGTANDLPAMQFGRGADDQMDCIDEATNTTSLLMMLAKHGYIRHHTVEAPSARGFFFDGRYPHATAVLTDTATGEKWAVDSWPRANGEAPLVMPLAQWKGMRTHLPAS